MALKEKLILINDLFQPFILIPNNMNHEHFYKELIIYCKKKQSIKSNQNVYFCYTNLYTMDLTKRKYQLIQELISFEEPMIEKLEKFVAENNNDWSNKMNQEELDEINEGLNQAEKDELIEHEVIMSKFSKWHSK